MAFAWVERAILVAKGLINLINLTSKTSFTYLLMHSDKHNSRTDRTRDLISSQINVASSQDVPFHQLQ